jgi:hypothetical protein
MTLDFTAIARTIGTGVRNKMLLESVGGQFQILQMVAIPLRRIKKEY